MSDVPQGSLGRAARHPVSERPDQGPTEHATSLEARPKVRGISPPEVIRHVDVCDGDVEWRGSVSN